MGLVCNGCGAELTYKVWKGKVADWTIMHEPRKLKSYCKVCYDILLHRRREKFRRSP